MGWRWGVECGWSVRGVVGRKQGAMVVCFLVGIVFGEEREWE